MEYTVTHNRQQQIRRMVSFEDQVELVTTDYTPWVDSNGSVTVVTVTVKSGSATVANESLAASVHTMTVSTQQTGSSVIQLKATAGNNVHVSNICILTKDPNYPVYDYGYYI